jgi:hypothetical protein
MVLRPYLTGLRAAAAVAAALTLTACAGEGVQLEGTMFDWMGVSSSALEGRKAEPKMADRAPLVVPPSVTRLPEPGTQQQPKDTDLAALKDPDIRKKAAAAERERLHLAYCRGEVQWKDKALNPNKGGANRSPYGPCPSLFSADNLNK